MKQPDQAFIKHASYIVVATAIGAAFVLFMAFVITHADSIDTKAGVWLWYHPWVFIPPLLYVLFLLTKWMAKRIDLYFKFWK